jgi:uroporphyrin-III C-methyltransferase
VCGITAALAAAASLGVSLTHRDWASGVLFITGHRQHTLDPSNATEEPDWQVLAQAVHRLRLTLVIYMGRHHEHTIASHLARYLPADTPVACVLAASTPKEEQKWLRLDEWAADTQYPPTEKVSPSFAHQLPGLWIVGDALRAATIDPPHR